jgi:hypothetical protein
VYLFQVAQTAVSAAQQGPWAWLASYLPLIGWPTVILGLWKASRFLIKVESRAVASEERLKIMVEAATTSETRLKQLSENNTELKQILEGQVNAQRELAQSVHQLAEAIHHQSELHSEQLQLMRDMSAEQKLLAQNQMVIMNGFQRVVEQLIDAVRD